MSSFTNASSDAVRGDLEHLRDLRGDVAQLLANIESRYLPAAERLKAAEEPGADEVVHDLTSTREAYDGSLGCITESLDQLIQDEGDLGAYRAPRHLQRHVGAAPREGGSELASSLQALWNDPMALLRRAYWLLEEPEAAEAAAKMRSA